MDQAFQNQPANDAALESGFPSEEDYNPADLLPGPEPEYLVLDWLADSRYIRPRTRQYYSSLLVLIVLLSLILFFARQMVLIVLIWAMYFLTYVLGRIQAEDVHIQITTYGIRYQDQLVMWEEISRFWVKEIHGFQQIHIEVPDRIFRQLVLLPSNQSSPVAVGIEDMVDLIGRVVPYQEPIPNQFDRWVQWLEQKFPLESDPVPPVAEPIPRMPGSEAGPVAPVAQPNQSSTVPVEGSSNEQSSTFPSQSGPAPEVPQPRQSPISLQLDPPPTK